MSNMNKSEIESFLSDFKAKLNIYDVFFKNRDKNEQALYDLEITAGQRKEFLANLNVGDYSGGPFTDAFDPESPANYEFGIMIKKKEVYIKINMGKTGKSVMCISFHIAEYKMKYPFKKKEKEE